MYGAGLGASAVLAYVFNALMGRRLGSVDFGTLGALLAVLLAFSGPSSALFGGGAMSTARTGVVPRAGWLRWVVAFGVACAVAALLPLPLVAKAAWWFGLASAMWVVISWNRGLLIGTGRLATTGGTIVFEGFARLGLAILLVARGWRVAGAAAGLALGMTAAAVLTALLLPRRGNQSQRIAPEVWTAIVGLFFLGAVQFPDVIAVRLFDGHATGAYTAASSLARIVVYAQAPAAIYALRRAATVGLRRSVRRTLALGLGPGLAALAVMLVFPRQILSVTYGGRYVGSVGLLRTLAVAMLLSGVTILCINGAMGSGRSGWAWPVSLVSLGGIVSVFALGGDPGRTAAAMIGVEGALLVAALVYVRRLLVRRPAGAGSVLILNWRDRAHPQGGGSELYVEEVARRLAREGREVTVFCAAHQNAPRQEQRQGIRFIRRGSWRTVYLWGAFLHLTGRLGRHDVVVDVQNAIPFFTPLVCGGPVVVLVHHLHSEQWDIVFGSRWGRIGWWVESRLAPRLYRRARYVTVSSATAADLIGLGVEPSRIDVVFGGAPVAGDDPLEPSHSARESASPLLVYLGRLVPHKRIDLLFQVASDLRPRFPGLRVRLLGQGPGEENLRGATERLGVSDLVTFEGFVDEERKLRMLAEAWVLALPSVKEGWGLVVVEAAAMRTPAVAFRVGGLQESILDGQTGLLASDYEEFREAVERLLAEPELRWRLGDAARLRAATFSWDATAEAFGRVLDHAVGADPVTAPADDVVDLEPSPGVAAEPA